MTARVIELTEYQTKTLAREDLDEATAAALHSNFGSQVRVEAPTFLNGNTWNLTAQGWVGYIPLTSEVHVSLAPKVPIHNLFGMLEYAYRLKGFKILKGLTTSASIAELYDNLALILAKKILDRIKRGLYRSYLSQDDHLPYLRGRMDVYAHVRNPVRVDLPCQFEDHTSDLEDNQILLWTLTRVLQCGFCTDRSLPYVRKALRSLQSFATTIPFTPGQCVDRLYSRLNEDYEPMHALCRFFLEHIGPTHQVGDRRMLPVLVDMEKLFEMFVVEWMKQNVSGRYAIRGQENIQMQLGQPIFIKIDIVVDDLLGGRTALVLDTKYKNPDQVALADIHQVVSYAEAKHCEKAVLVYPAPLSKPLDGPWGANIYVKSHSFRLDGDLDEAGNQFLEELSKSSGLPLRAQRVAEHMH